MSPFFRLSVRMYAMSLPKSGIEANMSAGYRSWVATLRRGSNYLFVMPMLIYILLTMAYPIFVNIQMSLHDVTVSTFRSNDAPFVGLTNYFELLQDPAFLNSVRLSLTFTCIS